MINLKYYVLLLIILNIVISTVAYSQNDESIVAQIGNDKITAREFKLRMELSPYIPKDKDIPKDSVKYDFLYSLIAEKLWALKAKEQGIENTQEFNFFFKPVEDLFVRDALFRQEIENRVNITASDMEKGIYKSQFTQAVRFFSSEDSVSIFKFYSQLIDSLIVDSLNSLYPSIDDTLINVKFGELGSEATEDTIYSLKKDSYSTPQKVPGGWILYYCVNNIFTPINISDQKTINKIREVIKGRKLEILYKQYRNNLLSGTNIKINSQAVIKLSNLLWKILKHKSPIPESQTTLYQVEESDFKKLLNSISEKELKTELFNIKNKQISLFDFLSKVAYSGFSIPTLDSNLVLSKLASMSKLFVEEQILTEEGYKKGYNLLPDVQNDLKAWKQKYLAQMYAAATLDTIEVNENQLLDYYNSIFKNSNNQKLVKLSLVTINNLDEVSNLLSKMNEGIQFNEIARSYGRTDSLVNDEGETDFISISMLNDLTNYVSEMKIGEVFGPVKRTSGYSIFQLVDTKQQSDSTLPQFEQVKSQIKTNLRYKLLTEKLNDITSKSSIQQDVKIFKNVVAQVQTSQIPMIVHRYMGFGGKIIGVPLTTPFSGWINNEIKQKLLP